LVELWLLKTGFWLNYDFSNWYDEINIDSPLTTPVRWSLILVRMTCKSGLEGCKLTGYTKLLLRQIWP
jgi:hypothetical protein